MITEGDIQQGFKAADKLILRHGVSDPSRVIRMLKKEVPNLTSGDISDILKTRKYKYYLDPTTTAKILDKLSRMPRNTKAATVIAVLSAAGLLAGEIYSKAKSMVNDVSSIFDGAQFSSDELEQFKKLADTLQSQYPDDPMTSQFVELYKSIKDQ